MQMFKVLENMFFGIFDKAIIGIWGPIGVGLGLNRLLGGDDEEEPQAPGLAIPAWAQGLPPEILDMIRQQAGQQLPEPAEYGISSQALQAMLGYQPEQFQLPISDIQQALAAQQQLQMQDYQRQIRPILAQQGQLDSTYYADLLGKYLQGQQAQTYGTTADLLTQQALQNLNLQQWLPQFQAGVAGQLAGLGGQRAGIGQFNLQLPFQTTIPALQQMYGTGLQEAGQQFSANLIPYQQDLQKYMADQAQQQAMMQMIGQLAGTAIGGTVGGPGGAMMGSQLGGSLGGTVGGGAQGGYGYQPQAYQYGYQQPTSQYGYQLPPYGMQQAQSRYRPGWSIKPTTYYGGY